MSLADVDETNMDAPEWECLELTCVRFPKGDVLGELLAFVSLVPHIILVVHATLLLTLLHPHLATFGAGTCANLAFNSVLKRVIREKRPVPTFRKDNYKYMVYGMPSQHAQFIAFYVVYLHLYVLMQVPHYGTRWEAFEKSAFIVLTTLLAGLVIYGRIYLIYHTPEQTAYGTVLGALCGYIWFVVTQKWLRARFKDMQKALAQVLRLRSLRNVPSYSGFLEESFDQPRA